MSAAGGGEPLAGGSPLSRMSVQSPRTMSAVKVPRVPRRVKVYELKEERWVDRGTGHCTGEIRKTSGDEEPLQEDAFLVVRSEEDEQRELLQSRVVREDVYQKQQDTLIVWTEPTAVDMALSFQEAEGCGEVWIFLEQIQSYLISIAGPDDLLSEDNDLTFSASVSLPHPELQILPQIEGIVREASASGPGREALAKLILNEDYLAKLVPLLGEAEKLHSLVDLHRLCNIVKCFILLNDQTIFEYAMRDDVVFGIAGILEYDPDFPNHKASHREYLSDRRRFRQVVPITHPETERKVHQTFRLQYFKDVVLARFIDDAAYNIFHSLILFNQIDIIQYLQQSPDYMDAVMNVFKTGDDDKKIEATFFIAQYCAMVKQLQPSSRSQPYNSLILRGLFDVFDFGLNFKDPAIHLAASDILTLITDNDPTLIRSTILHKYAENPKQSQLLATIIRLIHTDQDLGLKGQLAEALRVLLDPLAGPLPDTYGRTSEMVLRQRQEDPEAEQLLQHFYDIHVKTLLSPLDSLETRQDLGSMTRAETALYTHLCELVCYFMRMHSFRSKFVILSEKISKKISKLIKSPEKHLCIAALRYFRTLVGLNDEYYTRHLLKDNLFEPIVDLISKTSSRDNLINSACLEFFEHIRKEDMKNIIQHLVENFKSRLQGITYVDTFSQIVLKAEQAEAIKESWDTVDAKKPNGTDGRRWMGVAAPEHEEEEYFDEQEAGRAAPPADKSKNQEDDDLFEAKAKASLTKSLSAPELTTGTEDGNIVEREEVMAEESAAAVPPEGTGERKRRAEPDEEENDIESISRKRRSTLRRHSSGGDSPSPQKGTAGTQKIAIHVGKRSTGGSKNNHHS